GDTILCGPIEAALVNGTMAHADETDDTLAPGPRHPGCNVVPAALALGEQFGASGVHFLRAVVLGYDIGTRVLEAIQSGISKQPQALVRYWCSVRIRRGWRSHRRVH